MFLVFSVRLLCSGIWSPGRPSSGHGEHQWLFVLMLAKDVRQHEGGEEAELHSEAELEQLQVDAEHPLEHS